MTTGAGYGAKDSIGLLLAARPWASVARGHRGLAEEALAGELPWLIWLPVEERPVCVRELLADLVAGADTVNP